jgi:guanosine-3',5'-bis(diphosphate) 3'-pyrophosphohydrolase
MNNKLLAKAMAFAAQAHVNQFRTNGVPYFTHVYRVYKHVADCDGSYDQQIAALLHDTVEDCGISLETITVEFGSAISKLVHELTNDYSDHLQGDEKIEAIKRHASHMSMEAVMVKLCDRYDNLNDLDNWKPARVLRYFRQTIEMLNAFPFEYFRIDPLCSESLEVRKQKDTLINLRQSIEAFIKRHTEKYMLKV